MSNLEEFQTLIATLMSPDNASRTQAEATYNSTKESNPMLLLTCLSQTIRQCPQEALRAFAAVLLRRSCSEVWRNPQVDAATQAGVKSLLLQSIQQVRPPLPSHSRYVRPLLVRAGAARMLTERRVRAQESVKHILNKVADTISALALVIFAGAEGGGQWEELLPFMMQCSQSESALHRESAMNVFAQLATYLGKLLLPHQDTLKQLFHNCLTDASDGAVRLAALKAVCNFVPTMDDISAFADLLAPMVQVISSALSEGDEERARTGCEHVIELVDLDVKFLRSQIAAIADLMLQICNTAELDDNTRQLGMEFLVAVAEKSPGLARKMKLVDQVFPMALNFMLTIEDDEEWETHDDDNEDEEYSNYDVGEEALDRLAMAVGGKSVLPVANAVMQHFLENPDWRYRHAGLMAVSQIGEGCARQIAQSLGDVIAMVLAKFQDPHPRVKWAAINTIGQMATDFGPDLQNDHHQNVLTALMFAMEDQGSARVQSHAAAAVINFCEHAEADVMAPYLDALLNQLFNLLQHGRKIVLEQAITAVASVADSSEVNFGKYYDRFMPYLKDVLAKATTKEYRMMRGKAMECISLIGLAVGKEKFAPDAMQVMEVLMAAQQTEMEPDDPQISYMLQAWTRICKCLGRDFVPYLPYVMPPLLRSAEIQPEVQIADADDPDELEGMDTVCIGDKKIGIRTSGLEEKATACSMMACFLAELQDGFHDYIEQTTRIMVPLLQFYYNDEVRSAAVSCMPELIKCTAKFVEKNPAAAAPAAVTQISVAIYDQLVESIIREPEVDIQIAMLDALQESVEAATAAHIGSDRFRPFLEVIPKLWAEIDQRSMERQEAAQSEDFDEEELEVMNHEGSTDEEMQEMIVQCMGGFFKTFGQAFLEVYQQTPLAEHYISWLVQLTLP
jgi:HEAT repeat protein